MNTAGTNLKCDRGRTIRKCTDGSCKYWSTLMSRCIHGGFKQYPVNINKDGRPAGSRNKVKRETLFSLLYDFKCRVSCFAEIPLEAKKALIRAVFQRAIKGNIASMKLIFQYHDGLPKRYVQVSWPNEEEWLKLYEQTR